MDRKDVLRKIHKLKKLEQGAREIGSVEEAENAATKISRLQAKYKISQVEVTKATRDREDPIDEERWWPEDYDVEFRKKRIRWMQSLARIVADANFCEILVHPGSNAITFIGRESDRDVATYLYGFLVRQIEYWCDKLYQRKYNRIYNRDGDTSQMQGWKSSFRSGALASLKDRLDEMQQTVMEEADEEQHALIRTEGEAVQEYKENLRTGTASGLRGRTGFNRDGLKKGQEFGENVDLNRGLDGSESDSKKELPS